MIDVPAKGPVCKTNISTFSQTVVTQTQKKGTNSYINSQKKGCGAFYKERIQKGEVNQRVSSEVYFRTSSGFISMEVNGI